MAEIITFSETKSNLSLVLSAVEGPALSTVEGSRPQRGNLKGVYRVQSPPADRSRSKPMNRTNLKANAATKIVATAAAAICVAAISLYAQSSAPASPTTSQSAPAPLPSVDKILNKYLEASGGRVAWQKLNSRESKGVVDVPAMNSSGTIEVLQKAPSKAMVTITINGAVFSQGFDGKAGWSSDPQNGLRDQTGDELAETRRDADFYLPLDMHTLYSKFKITGTEDVDGHSTYAVEATPADGGDPEKLYFAVDTGLLVRSIAQRHTPDGVTPLQEDFTDYRTVDGITVPFQTHTSGQLDFTIRMDEMHHNVAIEDAKFAKPAAQ